MTTISKVQYVYDYINKEMVGCAAFTKSMITDTRRNADMTYWRLSRAERRHIVREA